MALDTCLYLAVCYSYSQTSLAQIKLANWACHSLFEFFNLDWDYCFIVQVVGRALWASWIHAYHMACTSSRKDFRQTLSILFNLNEATVKECVWESEIKATKGKPDDEDSVQSSDSASQIQRRLFDISSSHFSTPHAFESISTPSENPR